MWTVKILVRVAPDKRDEFIHAARDLMTEESLLRHRIRLFRDVDDRDVYCWLADAQTRSDLSILVEALPFHALRGAAEVLGDVEELRVLRDQP